MPVGYLLSRLINSLSKAADPDAIIHREGPRLIEPLKAAKMIHAILLRPFDHIKWDRGDVTIDLDHHVGCSERTIE